MLRALSGFDLPGGVPLSQLGIGIDGRVFAFALGLAVLTGVAFGVVPALRAGRRDPSASLRFAAHTSQSEGDRMRRALVAAQVCACLVLLSVAGLFLRGLRSGLTYDLGVEHEGLALARFDFSLLRYQPDEAMQRVDRILERVKALPAVTSAAVSTYVPLQVGGWSGYFVDVDGYTPARDEEMRVEMAFATEDFFRALGTRLTAGGDLDAQLMAAGEPVVIINQQMANAYWSGRVATGGTVRFGDRPMRVVGVTEDPAWRVVPQPPLNFVTGSLRQFPSRAVSGTLTLAVRTTGDAQALLAPIRQAILAVDPDLTFQYVRTMDDVLATHLSAQRMGALLLTLFGSLALVLSFVGIGGVVAYIVGRQRREIGIRLALGASRARVEGSAMLGMALPIGAGLATGVWLAVRLGRAVQGFLVEASATEPATYAGAAALLATITLLAAWLPARRAAAVDPVRVLRAE
jgi:predicted permease